MASAAKFEDRAVVDESIDDGRRGHRIGEDLGPLLEGQVSCDGDAPLFVSLRDNLEGQVRCLPFERHVAEFVDEQEIISIERTELSRQRSISFCVE